MENAIFEYLQNQLPNYKLLCQIGKGAYGIVYKIQRRSDNTYFALKTMELHKMNPKTIRNTLNEIRILCSIDNKFVCGYEEALTIDNGKMLCIVMEYVGGGDMYSKIETCKKKKYRINEESIWKYLCQILLGLKTLHDLKIIHRDIKSANLLLTEDFEIIKLADMGIAKIAKQDFAETQVGTPYYLAPEIWQKNVYDYRCDIFSLGCVTYEMATLRVPFQGESLQALYKSVKRGLIKRIPSIYSSELYGIIKLMLKRNPLKRPSAEEMLQHPVIEEKLREFNLVDFQEDQQKIGKLMETIILPSQLCKLNNVLQNQKKIARTKSCCVFEVEEIERPKKQIDKKKNPPLKQKLSQIENKKQIISTKQYKSQQSPHLENSRYKFIFDSKKPKKNPNVTVKINRALSNAQKKSNTKQKLFKFIQQLIFIKMNNSILENSSLFQNDSPEGYYTDLVYLCIYSACWLLLIEISLIIVLHFKQHGSYVANHSFINISIIITQAINFGLFWRRQKFTFAENYAIFELTMFVFELFQILLGSTLNTKLQMPRLQRSIFFLRIAHRYQGRLIYLLRKCLIGHYIYFFVQNKFSLNPLIVIISLYAFITLMHLLAFFLIRGKPFNQDTYPIEYLIDTSKDANAYQQLLQQIQNNEVEGSLSDDQKSLERLQTENRPLNRSLLDQDLQKDIKWVIIEDLVFEIESFRHPKGQYILNRIEGKDITREVHGLKSIRYENSTRSYAKTLCHKHSPRTLRHIAKHCIGPLELPKLIVKDDDISKEISSMSLDLKVLDKKLSFFQKDNLVKYENFYVAEKIQLGDQNQLFFVEKQQHSYFFILTTYWLDLFGKYFLIKENSDIQYLFFAICLAPKYITLKREWLIQINNEISEWILQRDNKFKKQIQEIGSALESELNDKELNLLSKNPDNISDFNIPLVKSFKKKNLKNEKNFYLKGPLGNGLGFDDQTTHKFLFLVEDDGILPFVDLLEFLSQRVLIEYFEKNDNSHPIFKRDYFYSYCNEVEIYIYWELGQNFAEAASILGIEQLQTIFKVYEKDSDNKVNQILKRALLSGHKKEELIEHSKTKLGSLSEIIKHVIPEDRENLVTRFIVSGSDKFVDKILTGTKEKLRSFTIL